MLVAGVVEWCKCEDTQQTKTCSINVAGQKLSKDTHSAPSIPDAHQLSQGPHGFVS